MLVAPPLLVHNGRVHTLTERLIDHGGDFEGNAAKRLPQIVKQSLEKNGTTGFLISRGISRMVMDVRRGINPNLFVAFAAGASSMNSAQSPRAPTNKSAP